MVAVTISSTTSLSATNNMKKILSISLIMFCAMATCLAQTQAKVSVNGSETTVYALFSNGEKAFWPFTQEKASSKAAEPSCAGEETTLSLKCKGSVDFEVFDADGYTINTRTGFRFGNTPGDYIILPVIKGKALKSVTLVFGAPGFNGKPEIREVKSGATAKGGSALIEKIEEAGEEYTWTLSGTKSKLQYEIYFTYKGQAQIHSMTIVYE